MTTLSSPVPVASVDAVALVQPLELLLLLMAIIAEETQHARSAFLPNQATQSSLPRWSPVSLHARKSPAWSENKRSIVLPPREAGCAHIEHGPTTDASTLIRRSSGSSLNSDEPSSPSTVIRIGHRLRTEQQLFMRGWQLLFLLPCNDRNDEGRSITAAETFSAFIFAASSARHSVGFAAAMRNCAHHASTLGTVSGVDWETRALRTPRKGNPQPTIGPSGEYS